MRLRNQLPVVALVSTLLVQGLGAPPAKAQDATSPSKRRLDQVLVVLRNHQTEAGKACLDAMTNVHQTEDQVASLGTAASNNSKSDNASDLAHDVLDSDYEVAEAACESDARRVCVANPNEPACGKLSAAPPN